MIPDDLKVRKQWKFMLIATSIFTLIHQFVILRFDPNFSDNLKLGSLLATIGCIAAFNFSLYRSAYKKPGTKFLLFMLIVMPLSLIASLITYAAKMIPFPSHIPFYSGLFFISLALFISMVSLHWKMRKINLRIKCNRKPF